MALAAGRTASFALTLTKTALARVLHFLRRDNQMTARITIRGRDAAGNVARKTRTVKLIR
jgi:hypothetical protein